MSFIFIFYFFQGLLIGCNPSGVWIESKQLWLLMEADHLGFWIMDVKLRTHSCSVLVLLIKQSIVLSILFFVQVEKLELLNSSYLVMNG